MINQITHGLFIRQAKPDDVIQCLRIQIDALRGLCSTHYSKVQIEAMVERNIAWASNPLWSNGTVIAQAQIGVVGFASLMGARITAIFVRPQMVRRGIGTQLIKQIEQNAKAQRATNLIVAASINAQGFYQAHSYRIKGQSRICTKERVKVPYIIMEKSMAAS